MRLTALRRLAVLVAVCALGVAGPLTGAAHANEQPAATEPVFDINGIYDAGGPARAVISNVDDILFVDMSAFGRPPASGVVVDSDTIVVTFPDDSAYGADLVAPGTIRWSNGTVWHKIVPSVEGLRKATAMQILRSAGLTGWVSQEPIDRGCTRVGKVHTQDPQPGARATGALVSIEVWKPPPGGC